MTNSTLYGLVLVVVICAAALTAVFSPESVPIAIPLYATVAASVIGLLQQANTAVTVKHQTAKVEEIAEVAKSTHVMVNNNFLVQLELTAELSRWKADRDPTPENIRAAAKSDALLAEHKRKQAISDTNIPRSGFGEMPEKTPAEAAVADEVGRGEPERVSVETMSPEAARAIADAVRPDISDAVHDAVTDAAPEKKEV